jgi:alpha-1,2-mannosyltransferase
VSVNRPPSSLLPSWLLWLGLAAFTTALSIWALSVNQNSNQLWLMLDLRCYIRGRTPGSTRPGPVHAPLLAHPDPLHLSAFRRSRAVRPSSRRFPHGAVSMTAANCAALILANWFAWGMLGHLRSQGRLGAALLTALLGLWLEPVQQNLIWGQINLLLMLLVMADYALPDRSRWKGVGIGLAAGFKLTPAIHIPYLLLTGRRRQAAIATATFSGTILLGFLVLPREANQYWLGGLFDDPVRVGTVSYLSNQSLHGLLGRAVHDSSNLDTLWLFPAAAVGVFGLLLAARQHRRGRELLGILTTAVTGLLVSPISWSHHTLTIINSPP